MTEARPCRIPYSSRPLTASTRGRCVEDESWGLSKKGANYKPAPTPDVRCDSCTYMFPPLALGGVQVGQGLIQGSGTCDRVQAKDKAAAALLHQRVESGRRERSGCRGIDEVRSCYAGAGTGGRRTSTSSSILESLKTSETATSPPSTARSIAGRKRVNSPTSGGHGSNTRSVRAGS